MARTDTDTLGIEPFDPAQYLTSEEAIAEFLNAAVEMDDPAVLLLALGTVARARGMTQLAAASGLGRESLYKALAPGAQPRYETVMRVAHALGVRISFHPLEKAEPPGTAKAKPRPANTSPDSRAIDRPGAAAKAATQPRSARRK